MSTPQNALLRIEKLDCGFGPVKGAWTLCDPQGAHLSVGHHGGVAPTRQACVDEARHRIERGDGYTGFTG